MTIPVLVKSIRRDTDCLWMLTKSVLYCTNSKEDIYEAVQCHTRLKAMLAEYYERRLDVLDSAYLWFVEQVLHAFEDLYTRFVIHSR